MGSRAAGRRSAPHCAQSCTHVAGVVHTFHAIHAKVYVKIASKSKNSIDIHLTHSGFTEIGRATEKFTDLDLDYTAMKPDNKKRRSKKRRPAGYYGGWERKRIVKAKKLKRNIKKAGKWMCKYMKEHPEHKHLKTVIILSVMMKRYGFSLRWMIAELYFRRGSRKAAGLKRVPSKSWLHK